MTEDDLDLSHALYSASSRAFRKDQDYPEAIAHRLARDHEEALRVWQAFSDRVTKAIRVKLLDPKLRHPEKKSYTEDEHDPG